jgi:hypothetical protein
MNSPAPVLKESSRMGGRPPIKTNVPLKKQRNCGELVTQVRPTVRIAESFSTARYEHRVVIEPALASGVPNAYPDKFFDMIYKLYGLKRKNPDSTKHPQFFGKFIRKYIYYPLANSHGAILEHLEQKNPTSM